MTNRAPLTYQVLNAPDAEDLPPGAAELLAEHRELVERLAGADAEVRRLEAPEALAAAQAADAEARTEAVRARRDPADVGSPSEDAHRATLTNAVRARAALVTEAERVGEDLRRAFEAVVAVDESDDTALVLRYLGTGFDRFDAALDEYRDAIDRVAEARQQVLAAGALPGFALAASTASPAIVFEPAPAPAIELVGLGPEWAPVSAQVDDVLDWLRRDAAEAARFVKGLPA